MAANIRNAVAGVVLLLSGLLVACGKKPEPVPAPPAAAPTATAAAAPKKASTERPPEPTETEIRELIAENIDAQNRNGGIVLTVTATGKQSAPIMMRMDGYEKSKCIPYTKAWRCEGTLSLSYPGSNFPSESLRHSRRFQKNEQEKWTMD